jgi:hypothetical protein
VQVLLQKAVNATWPANLPADACIVASNPVVITELTLLACMVASNPVVITELTYWQARSVICVKIDKTGSFLKLQPKIDINIFFSETILFTGCSGMRRHAR